MNFKEYMNFYAITPKEFADKHKIGISTVFRYMAGYRAAGLHAFQIEKITNGEVTCEEMMHGKNFRQREKRERNAEKDF